ncbi:conserved hypothetical protein [Candidatus Sulfopaludibacter sp. SbA6]|nr:conserved hypothetical protein [Candidatus Sulfopaludibacter sp. SbA6]
MLPKKQKLYCYVDETGQDSASTVFVVVAVVSERDQEKLRQALTDIERIAGTGNRKWHKSRSARRLRYLELALERNLGAEDVFFGSYPKLLPYFFPLIEVLEHAIKRKAGPSYTAKIFVDGIDHKKAAELTNALRLRGMSLEMVKSRRDESEPIIRLADMWAGCVRAAIFGRLEERDLLKRAAETKYIRPTKEKTP